MATISVSLPSDGSTIDAADYNTPINTIVSEINGGLDNANIKSAAAIAGSKLADASIDIGSKASVWDGWIAVSDSWSYASATTITVPSDATTKYSVGDKIKLVQSATTKYFYVTAVASTVLTVTGGTDYTVANSAISGIYYSKAETPLGFPDYFATTTAPTNITVGSGTFVHRFKMIGRTVSGYMKFTFGSGSSVSSGPTFTLPITGSSNTTSGVATGYILDSGTDRFPMTCVFGTTSRLDVFVVGAGATYANQATISSTVPMTWTTNDIMAISYTYEAA